MIVVQVLDGETIKPVLDMTGWLGTASITSTASTRKGEGTVVASEASGIITLTVSGVEGVCDITVTITSSDGRVRIERLRIRRTDVGGRDDYGSYHL